MEAEKKTPTKKSFSPDWLVRGVLTKLGDTFDRLTGRGWNPSSSLATSKLIEKLKFLLDSEVRDLGKDGKFVPHVIKLKIQWDKFSTDSDSDLDKLRYELHAAAIDHINDRLYHTYAPLEIEIKTDYFTDGVKMFSSFGKFSDKEDDEVSINVTVPQLKVDGLIPGNKITVNLSGESFKESDDCFIVRFTAKNKPFEIELNFTEKKRISVGRSKESDLTINDQSVSKIHAALVLNDEKKLMVADTGSTNGTYINDKRIAYGKANIFEDDAEVKFGTVPVTFERLNIEAETEQFEEESDLTENTFRAEGDSHSPEILPTRAAINLPAANKTAEPHPTEAILEGVREEVQNQKIAGSADSQDLISSEKSEDSELEMEDFLSQPELEPDNKSEEVNLNKTQDWEV